VLAFSVLLALGLWAALERTRLGMMIRASVDDMQMARAVGIPASRLFTLVFALGAALAGVGGVIAAPILSVYPGMDADMLPLALVVVILGGLGSLAGAFAGSMLIGFVYSFGQVLVPNLAYIILFLPMVLILAVRPRGLFGRISA
jgi:branched-chain amino acid transport system permease protein